MRSLARSAVSQDDDRLEDERRGVFGSSIEYPVKIERGTNENQGNPDSGYAPSSQNLEAETQLTLFNPPSSDHPVAIKSFSRNTRGRFDRKAGCEDGDDLDDEENDKDLRATGRGNRMSAKSQAAGNEIKVQQSSSSSSHPEHHPHHLPSSQDKKKTRKESVLGDSSGSKDEDEDSPSFDEGDDRILPPSTSASPAPTATTPGVSSVSAAVVLEEKKKKRLRFHLRRKKPKETTKKREKASAKRERKATKTLAIVLGKKSIRLTQTTVFHVYSPCNSRFVCHILFIHFPSILFLHTYIWYFLRVPRRLSLPQDRHVLCTCFLYQCLKEEDASKSSILVLSRPLFSCCIILSACFLPSLPTVYYLCHPTNSCMRECFFLSLVLLSYFFIS